MEDERRRIISIMDKQKSKTDLVFGLATDLRLDPECRGFRHPSIQPITSCGLKGGTQNTMDCGLETIMDLTVEVDLGLATQNGAVPNSSPPQPGDRGARPPIKQPNTW